MQSDCVFAFISVALTTVLHYFDLVFVKEVCLSWIAGNKDWKAAKTFKIEGCLHRCNRDRSCSFEVKRLWSKSGRLLFWCEDYSDRSSVVLLSASLYFSKRGAY